MEAYNRVPTDIYKVELGKAITPEMINKVLFTGEYDLITVTHNETSTGITNPIEAIGEVVKKYDDIIMLICTFSVGSHLKEKTFRISHMGEYEINKLRLLGCNIIDRYYENHELGKVFKVVDALVIRSKNKITRKMIDEACEGKRLKLIIMSGVGFDNIDVKYAEDKGITVINMREAYEIRINMLGLKYMYTTLDEVLSASDFLTIHIPYEKEKGYLITKKEIDKMKYGIYFINHARGKLVCELVNHHRVSPAPPYRCINF